MVQTHGLTHINLAVRDLGRALRFYEQVFGLREYGRGDGLVHTQASGRHDIVTFVEDPTTAGLSGGIAHFGFRLVDPDDIRGGTRRRATAPSWRVRSRPPLRLRGRSGWLRN
jgi:catechol 2,3-dioxygenase-like lactoylglutathione lyase family enzyme